jgi:hypothetical protein
MHIIKKMIEGEIKEAAQMAKLSEIAGNIDKKEWYLGKVSGLLLALEFLDVVES